MEDKIKEIMADILSIGVESIFAEFGPDDADAWDSLNNLRMITALEEAFSIQLTMQHIRQMNTFASIRDIISQSLKD